MFHKSDLIHDLEKMNIFKLAKAALVTWLANEQEKAFVVSEGASANKAPIFLANHNDVVWLDNNDVECFWTTNAESLVHKEVGGEVKHWIRLKSGKEFEVTEEAWYKVMHGMSFEYKKTED